MAKRRSLQRPEKIRIPWFSILRIFVLAVLGVGATAWAVDRALHRKPEPMIVPRPEPWPPPGTMEIDVTPSASVTSPSSAPK